KYTGNRTDDPDMIHSIRADFTPSHVIIDRLRRLNDTVKCEINIGVDTPIPLCKDWTRVPVYHIVTRVITQVSGRLFLGQEICQTSEYIDQAVNYTTDAIDAIIAIKKIYPWLRFIFAPRLAGIRN
ncbi:hypothetical protein COCVIDRAFT_102810, partial [Bipolaris victoriae FI3]